MAEAICRLSMTDGSVSDEAASTTMGSLSRARRAMVLCTTKVGAEHISLTPVGAPNLGITGFR